MSTQNSVITNEPQTERRRTLLRVVRYSSVRLLSLAVSTIIGIYILVVIANLGGFVDDIFEARIEDAKMGFALANRELDKEERQPFLDQLEADLRVAYGLDTPFWLRCARWAWNGLTFQWGNAERLKLKNGEMGTVAELILERMPYTLLLAGTANLFVFFASLYISLSFAHRRNKFFDRLIMALSPISSAPSWIHGIVLISIFAIQLRWLPYGGVYQGGAPETFFEYLWVYSRYLILPVTAIFFSIFFQNLSAWRTFFVVQSGEDYVELAKAKGLSDRNLNRRYILRPNLPIILTNFALMVMGFWQGAIALEILFDWPGIGSLYWDAITRIDRPVVVGLMVIFAYLFAFTVFILDILYSLVDPRVKVEDNRIRGVHRSRRLKDYFNWLKRDRSPVRPEKRKYDTLRSLPETDLKASRSGWLSNVIYTWKLQIAPAFRQLIKYPMAVVGLLIVMMLTVLSLCTVITIPYAEVVTKWRSNDWIRNPRHALPMWVNWFRVNDLPESIILNTVDDFPKERKDLGNGMIDVITTFDFEYPYTEFPQGLTLIFSAEYEEKFPFISLTWIRPDGTRQSLADFAVVDGEFVKFDLDDRFDRVLDETQRIEKLFGDNPENPSQANVVQGTYQLQVNGLVFEPESDIDVEMLVYGKVYGWAGTDQQRRDLALALRWGMPVALSIGVAGAIFTAVLSLLLAALGAWRGGWIDGVIQRVSEINIIMPALPLALIVYYVYSKSIWPVLGVLVVTRIFGPPLKVYRAMLLQIKQAPFIEAAQSYGASDWRIVRKYLMPRIALVVVPDVISLVPTFVFLETTLAFLGITDPYIPTWGKIIFDALSNGGLRHYYYWVLEPIGLVLLTGLAFAMIGYSLDDILNPRLRDL